MDAPGAREVDRIRAAYGARDTAQGPGSAWLGRAHRLRMQQLESALLEELALAGLDPSGARVAEIGCGGGYFLSRFLDYGAAQAAGIDLMETRIAIARARDPRLELVVGDAAQLPWPDGAFDLVTQFTCLSSVLDRGLRRRIAAEMWRVTSPGGAIVSYDMRTPSPVLRAIRRVLALHPRARSDGAHTPTEPVDGDELRALFPGAEARIRPITLATDLAALAQRSRPLSWALMLPRFPRTHLLAVARKLP